MAPAPRLGRPSAPPLLPAALAVAGGISLATTPWGWAIAPPLVVLAHSPRIRGVALAILLGLLLGRAAAAAPPPPEFPPPALRPTAHVLEGTVRRAEPPAPGGTRVVLDLESVGEGPERRAVRGAVRLTVEGGSAPAPLPGSRVRVPALVEPMRRPGNPGAADTAGRWALDGVGMRGRVPDAGAFEVLEPARGLAPAIARLRFAAAARYDAALPPEDAGFARSLVLGDRALLSAEDRARFRATGQAHVIAVSGFHVTLIVAGLLVLTRRIGCGRRASAAVGLAAVVLYVPFSGASASAVRAGVGGILYLAARLLGREAAASGVLCAVALGVLVADPGVCFDVGFQLSVASVIGILLLGPRIEAGIVPPRLRVPGLIEPRRALLRRTFAFSLGAWFATAPLVLGHLGQVCAVGPIVAVAAIPLGSLLIVLGFVVLGVAPLAPLSAAACFLFSLVADGTRAILDFVVALHLGAVAAPSPGAGWQACYVAAFLAATHAPPRFLLLSLAAMTGLLTAAVRAPPVASPGDPRLVLLDVGHGQAAVLSLPDGRTALLDAGSRNDPEVGRRVIAPALGALGVGALDLVAISHEDADHWGGAPSLLEEVHARDVVVPPVFGAWARARLERAGARVRSAAAGDVLLEGGWGSLRVVSPPAKTPSAGTPPGGTGLAPAEARWSDNDASLVLLLETAAGRRLLVTGDVEGAAVRHLLAGGGLPAVDVLLLPHHGVPGEGRGLLVRATQPRLLLASCGRATLATLPEGTWSTAEHGAIEVVLAAEGVGVAAPWSRARGGPGYDPPPVPAATAPPEGLAVWVVAGGLLAFAVAAVRLRWLTAAGAALAWVLGVAAFLAFGAPGLAALFAPFLAATLLGRLPGLPRTPARTWVQVLSNGLPAFAGALTALLGRPDLGAWAFLGTLSCLGADSCATEVGVRYGGTPRSLLTGARLVPGESGGVTPAGLATTLGGSLLAPAAWLAAGDLSLATAALVSTAGVAGALIDSLAGAALQYRGKDPATGARTEARVVEGRRTERVSGFRWLDNDAVNLVAGIAAAVLAAALGGLARG